MEASAVCGRMPSAPCVLACRLVALAEATRIDRCAVRDRAFPRPARTPAPADDARGRLDGRDAGDAAAGVRVRAALRDRCMDSSRMDSLDSAAADADPDPAGLDSGRDRADTLLGDDAGALVTADALSAALAWICALVSPLRLPLTRSAAASSSAATCRADAPPLWLLPRGVYSLPVEANDRPVGICCMPPGVGARAYRSCRYSSTWRIRPSATGTLEPSTCPPADTTGPTAAARPLAARRTLSLEAVSSLSTYPGGRFVRLASLSTESVLAALRKDVCGVDGGARVPMAAPRD